MVTENLSNILNDLNHLLSDNIGPHSISYQFEKITTVLNQEDLSIEKMNCKEYYEDGDLSLILSMKNEALANGQFEQASKFCIIEKELLIEKGDTEFTQLKTEASLFEYRGSIIIFHYNKRKENQRLIANLIEGYNMAHHKSATGKMLYY